MSIVCWRMSEGARGSVCTCAHYLSTYTDLHRFLFRDLNLPGVTGSHSLLKIYLLIFTLPVALNHKHPQHRRAASTSNRSGVGSEKLFGRSGVAAILHPIQLKQSASFDLSFDLVRGRMH